MNSNDLQNIPSGPFGPVWNNKTGIAKTVLNEPYLLLNINELKGPYNGTNLATSSAFAKLIVKSDTRRGLYNSPISSFVTMDTEDFHETYKYNPTNLSKLDKMTLNVIESGDGEEAGFFVIRYFNF